MHSNLDIVYQRRTHIKRRNFQELDLRSLALLIYREIYFSRAVNCRRAEKLTGDSMDGAVNHQETIINIK